MKDIVRELRTALEAELRHALERHEFEVYYQPKHRRWPSRRMVGAEALVRWRHPERGLVAARCLRAGMCERHRG
jgi:EAL domain-containing protein (putative c-di-GMP-specific phosphodiesterase class I)